MRIITKAKLYWLLQGVQIIAILLFFDSKVHTGGDDSDYIMAALDFVEGRAFPSWHGSLYPIVLSGFVAIGGINLLLLKLFSVALSVATFYVVHKTLENRLPDSAYYFALAITAASSVLATYASTTYSEPLFMFLQALVIYWYTAYTEAASAKKFPATFLLLSFAVFCLSITRNVGHGAAIVVMLAFIHEKRWVALASFVGIFGSCHTLLYLYKALYWKTRGVGMEGQFSRIAYKNFYDPNDGNENFTGFVVRFLENSNQYLSKHLAKFIGLRPFAHTPSATVTVLLYALFICILIVSYKRNRLVFFIMIYVAVMLCVTFITQQVQWDQDRLVFVYLPYTAAALGFMLAVMKEKKSVVTSRMATLALVALPLLVLFQTAVAPKNILHSISEIGGYKFAGYSPEWKNYAALCAWTKTNLPDDARILCRKPGMAGVYGDRKFFGISRFHYTVPDSAAALLNRQNIHYVILDNLNLPTVERLLAYYLSKYPLGLELVKQVGTVNPSYLLKITRSQATSDAEYVKRLQAGIAVCPTIAYYYVLAANHYLTRNDFSNALRLYSAALYKKATPDELLGIQCQRAEVLARTGKLDQAKKDLDIVLKKSPKHRQAWYVLAYVFQQKGMTTESANAYKNYLSR